jgi:hypothetical protein
MEALKDRAALPSLRWGCCVTRRDAVEPALILHAIITAVTNNPAGAAEMGEELMERCTETKAVATRLWRETARPRPQRMRSSSGCEFAARTRIEEI